VYVGFMVDRESNTGTTFISICNLFYDNEFLFSLAGYYNYIIIIIILRFLFLYEINFNILCVHSNMFILLCVAIRILKM
jgi:hypothetical protein